MSTGNVVTVSTMSCDVEVLSGQHAVATGRQWPRGMYTV